MQTPASGSIYMQLCETIFTSKFIRSSVSGGPSPLNRFLHKKQA